MGELIRFGHIEAAAAALLNIPSHKRTALAARMKNLLRIGLLPDLDSKRGAVSFYSERQALELLLATSLNFSEMVPEYVVFLISRRRDLIHKSAERGLPLIFHPEGALHRLQEKPVRKRRTITEVWPVGALRTHLLKYLPA